MQSESLRSLSGITRRRRGFLIGIGAILAAPAIVRVASLMPIKAPPLVFAETWQHRVFALGYYVREFPDINEVVLEAMLYGQAYFKTDPQYVDAIGSDRILITSRDIGVVPNG